MVPSDVSVMRNRVEYLEGEVNRLSRRLDAERAGQRALRYLDSVPRRPEGRPNKQTTKLTDLLKTMAREIEVNNLANDAEFITELEDEDFPRELIELAAKRMIKTMEDSALGIAQQAVADWTRKRTTPTTPRDGERHG